MTDDEMQSRQLMVQALMRTLQRGAGGRRWKEVADGVLDGSFTLREAAESTAFRELFHDAVARLNEHRAEVGDGFDAEGARAADMLAKLTRELGYAPDWRGDIHGDGD